MLVVKKAKTCSRLVLKGLKNTCTLFNEAIHVQCHIFGTKFRLWAIPRTDTRVGKKKQTTGFVTTHVQSVSEYNLNAVALDIIPKIIIHEFCLL